MSIGNLARWQTRLVPLMVSMVVFAALFFSVVSIREFEAVRLTLEHRPSQLNAVLHDYDRLSPGNFEEGLSVVGKKAALVLEHEAVAYRYQQAHAIILARLWTRFMAFTTGTLMALIGAAFILGKIREAPSELAGSTQGISVSMRSASPGIMLAALGTILIVAALFSYFEVRTTDPPSYVTPDSRMPAADEEDSHLSPEALSVLENEGGGQPEPPARP